jgi:hypothetical protein
MKNVSHALNAAFVAAIMLSAPAAFASNEVDPVLKEKLSAKLKADGYEIRKVQMEDGLIEAYAVKNGKKFELYFDNNLKPVTKAD